MLTGVDILIHLFEWFHLPGYMATRMGLMSLRLLHGLLVHCMIPFNIVSLFRVYTLVFVAAMVSPLLGAIGEFDHTTKTLTMYLERLDQFFVANNIGSYPVSAFETVIAAAVKNQRLLRANKVVVQLAVEEFPQPKFYCFSSNKSPFARFCS